MCTKDEERETNKMQLIWCLLSNFYLDMFRASLCPSSGEQKCVLPHMVFCTGCDGCDCVELGRKLCALCQGYCSNSNLYCSNNNLDTVHTARVPTPHNLRHHNQCRTPYAVIHSLVLLKMGIMLPKTCWYRNSIINIRLIASCWFLSVHPTFMMHGHKSLKCAQRSKRF